MDKPAAMPQPFAPTVLDRHMPMPPVCTSDEVYPGWDKLRICLYRLPPAVRRAGMPAYR